MGALVTQANVIINLTTSAAIDLAGSTLQGIVMPATWTTANLTFQASADGVPFNDMYTESGTEVNVSAGASRYIRLEPGLWTSVRFLQIRSGTTGTPVAQAASRTLVIVVRKFA